MSNSRFWTTYTLLAVCQIVICNYFNFSPLVTLSILPAMVICIPVSVRTPWAMVAAFVTGLAVDFTSDAVLGLNALALVPVALCRGAVLETILGRDFTERRDRISIRTKGFAKVSGVNAVAVAIFFIIYITADGAGTRPFLFNLIRFAASGVASFLLSLAVVTAFTPRDRI